MKDKNKISYSNVLQKLTQENVIIYKQLEKISSERNKLRAELIKLKEDKLNGQEQIIQENNNLSTKLFLVEQKLEKTQNLYEILKRKSDRKHLKNMKNGETSNIRSRSQNNANNKNHLKKNNFTIPTNPNDRNNVNMNINKKVFVNIAERKKDEILEDNNEVYILDPTKALLKLNNELLFYKESHQKFLKQIKIKQETIDKYENMINKLNSENNELKQAYKLKLMKVNNEKENILSLMAQNNLNMDEQSNNKILTIIDNNDNSSINCNTAHTLEQINLNNNQLKKIMNKEELIGKETTFEEFGTILKRVGLNRELFEKMSQIKGFSKLTDSVEFFYKLCLEKNKQILILEKENENLVFKNYELNKLNIELENELKLYKSNNSILNINNIKKILDDDSTINNHSRNTNNTKITNTNNTNNTNIDNNLNINYFTNSKTNSNLSIPLLNYKKLLEKKKEEEQLKEAELIFNLSLGKENGFSSSRNDSNNDAEIMDIKYDNNEEKEKANDENNQFHSDIKSLGDFDFKESYNEVTNSNIDSIISNDFKRYNRNENQNQ